MSFVFWLRLVGAVFVIAGLVLARTFRSGEIARQRGLNRKLGLSPTEQFALLGRHPRVFAPLNLVVSGVLLLISSFVMTIARLLQ